jgi:hypothetical protein
MTDAEGLPVGLWRYEADLMESPEGVLTESEWREMVEAQGWGDDDRT